MKMFDVVASCNPDLVVDCISTFQMGVNRVEARRGIGVDAALRRRVINLFQKLGQKGQEAISRLNSYK